MATVLKGAGWRSKTRSSTKLPVPQSEISRLKLPPAFITGQVSPRSPQSRVDERTARFPDKLLSLKKEQRAADRQNENVGKFDDDLREDDKREIRNEKLKTQQTEDSHQKEDLKEAKDKSKEKEEKREEEEDEKETAQCLQPDDKNENAAPSVENQLPSRKEISSVRGAGYCKKVISQTGKSSLPRVPHYGVYSKLLPDSYVMPWKQDMKNRSAIITNVSLAGKEKLPNIEHNEFLFLRHREQLAPNVEHRKRVEKKVTMPSLSEILNPPFHHHTIKTKEAQRKAVFPAGPAMQFQHPRLRHVTDCYSCVPDYDE